jgi:RND family efflux transporter MFP subunit
MSSTLHTKPIVPHRFRLVLMFLFMFGIFGSLLAFGILPRVAGEKEIMADSKQSPPVVYATTPSFARDVPPLNLPGDVSPYYSTYIYSRISGTLKERSVDIGSQVKEGQVLAVVDVPDLDQQLEQAKAQLLQAQQTMQQTKFSSDFAVLSFKRWKESGQGGAIAQQDIDQRQNDLNVAQANYQAAVAAVTNNEANVKRLEAMESYKQIKAPFSGIISQRNVDPGANIVSGGSSTSTNLFQIEQIDKLRIFVNVPQAFVPFIKPGVAAKITAQEYAGKTFHGEVLSTANMLDPASRTLLTQIIVSNPDHTIYPGLYTNVSFDITKNSRVMTVPDNTIVTGNHGLKVVEILPDHKLHYLPIQVGRDYGTEIEVKSGLTGHETLVTNPLDSFKDGQTVEVAVAKKSSPH